MPNNDYPFQNENAPSGDYPSADKTVVNNPYADSWPAGLQPDPYTSPQAATPQPSPYESPNVQDGQVASPGSTAPQHRIMQDAPTVQMRRPPTSRQNLPADQASSIIRQSILRYFWRKASVVLFWMELMISLVNFSLEV